MVTVSHPRTNGNSTRIALYCRVSSEDQAERQTIQNQIDFLTRWAELHQRPVAEVYTDDGVSGTVPLAERPAGKRLLEDARAGRFSVVVLYRLDRLGRKLRVLLDAYATLEDAGVAIVSAADCWEPLLAIGAAFQDFRRAAAPLLRAWKQQPPQ
ncbi:MAG: recombinase family protein [Chloroflexi bacterium]|nr:recombinase family protein [Chloroflexota bacterium]